MGGGGACARDRNMRQGGQVVHGKTQAIDVRSKLAIGDASAHSDSSRLWIERHLVEKLQRDLIFPAVRDPVERMARAQCLQLAALLYDLLDFLYRPGKMQPVGTVLVVARPIGAGRGLLLTIHQAGQYAAGDKNARSFQELSFVHSPAVSQSYMEIRST